MAEEEKGNLTIHNNMQHTEKEAWIWDGHAELTGVKEYKTGTERKCLIPGRCSKGRDPSLEYSHEERERVFFYYHKIYQRKEDASMDDETHNHGDHIHPQLPRNHLQVSNGDDLSTDETGNTNRGVPEGHICDYFLCHTLCIYNMCAGKYVEYI